MTISRTIFNPQELCSRKLWDMVSSIHGEQNMDETELREAIAELAERRHYLAELQQIGKLDR